MQVSPALLSWFLLSAVIVIIDATFVLNRP